MAFITKLDYSNNRQIKQFELTNTQLSGTTVFGVPFSGLTSGINPASVSVTSTLINIVSSFSGNTSQTNISFGDNRMVNAASSLYAITNTTSGDTQVALGYTGSEFSIIDGNVVFSAYTGSTYDLTVTSIEEVAVDTWTGQTISNNVYFLSGTSLDFNGRAIWVDVKGITRTEKLILVNKPDPITGVTTVLTRDEDGEIYEVEFSAVTNDNYISGATFSATTGDLILTTTSGETITTNLDGRYLPLSATTGDDYVTGSTFDSSSGLLEFNRLSGDTFNVNLGFTSGDTTNWDSAYNEAITGATVTGTSNKSINLKQRNGGVITATFVDLTGGGAGETITGMTFNPTTGDLDLTTNSGSTITSNLDGRYSLTGHTHDFSAITNTGHTHTISEISDFPTNVSYFTNDLGYLTGYTDTNDNIYVTGSTFNISDGILEFTNISGGTFTVDLDGRYLTGYTETSNTDDYVTGAAWDENTGVVTFTRLSGSTFNVNIDNRYSLTGHTHPQYLTGYTDNNDYVTGATFNTSDGNLTLSTLSGTSIIENLDGRYLTGYTETGNTDDYVTGVTFNISDGVLTFTRLSGSTFNVDLDDRYSLTGHTHDFNTLTNTGHTHTVSEITDFPTNVSSFTNDVGYLTGYTETGNTDDYVTGHTFNTSTGLFESTLQSGSTVTVNLDGRYSLTGHTHSQYLTGYTDNNDYVTGATFNSGTGDLTLSTLSGNTIIENLDGRYLTGFTPTINTDDYVTGGTFNITTGILEFTRLSGGTFNIDLDDRYSLSGHTHTVSEITDFPTNVSYFTNDVGYLTAYTDTNIFVSGGTFSSELLEFTNTSGDTFSIDLSNTYSLTGHTHDLAELTNTGHTHTVSEITDFPTDLSAFTNSVGYITGFTNDNIYVSGGTFSSELLEFTNTSGGTFNIDLGNTYSLTGHTHVGLSDDYVTSGSLNQSTGDLTLTRISGGTIVTNLGFTSGDTTNWDSAYDDTITGMTITGTAIKTVTLTQRDGDTITANFTDTTGGGAGETITGATFDTLTGDLDLNSNSGNTITTNLDGRYSLTGHTHDFDTLTNTGHTHTISEITDFPTVVSYFTNDVGYLTGYTDTNIFVSGGTFNSEILQFTNTSGGTFNIDLSNTYSLTGHTHTVSEITDFPTDLSAFTNSVGYITGFTDTNDNDYVTSGAFDTTNGNLTLTRLSGGTVVTNLDNRYSLTGHTHDFSAITNTGHTHVIAEVTDFPTNVSFFTNDVGYLTGYTDNNDYVTGSTFNPSTGLFTSTRLSGGTFNTNLDGRYSLTGHTHVGLSDDYVTGHTFNTSTGLFTSTRQSGSTISVNLDGRYLSTTGYTAPSGLEAINEGNGIGLVKIGRTAANYGNIGLNAVDLSHSTGASTTRGATGTYSFTTGQDNTASSLWSIAMGALCVASGNEAIAMGYQNTATQNASTSFGRDNHSTGQYATTWGFSNSGTTFNATAGGNVNLASGDGSVAMGSYNTASNIGAVALGYNNFATGIATAAFGYQATAKSAYEVVVGTFNTSYSPISTTTFNAADRIFGVGIGTATGSRADALIILKNGTITAPSITNTLITNAGSKSLISLEYLNTYYTPSSGVTGNYLPLSGGTLTGPVTGTTFNVSKALLNYQENIDVDSAGSEVVATVSKLTYDAVFFDYVVKNGTNLRAGIVMAAHDGTSVVYTDTSTTDLGNTSGVTFTVNISGNDLRLVASVTTDNWVIKTLLRGI